MPKKKTTEEVRAVFEQAGFIMLGEYENSQIPIEFKCSAGHQGAVKLSDFNQAQKNGTSGCKECYAESRFAKAKLKYEAHALSRGFLLLDNYVNPETYIRYQCPNGHIRSMTPLMLKANKHGCSLCADIYRAQKDLTHIEDIRKLANSKGLELLTAHRLSQNQLLLCRCEHGHETSYTHKVLKTLSKCKQCSRSCKRTIDEVREIFEANGYQLLATEYVNAKTRMPARCPNGHNIQITYGQIQEHGRGCKICSTLEMRGPNYDADAVAKPKGAKHSWRGPEAKKWAEQVKDRDGRRCVACSNPGPRLSAHHLNSWGWFPAERYLVDNGASLCWPCHYKFHAEYGSRKNTSGQFYEWITQNKVTSNGR